MSLETDQTRSSTGGLWETGKIIVQALILAMIVRIFFYQPFNIPSGSMKDTLLVGDYLFVSKLSYGYSRYSFPWGLNLFSGRVFGAEPKRGDVAVFKLPRDNSTDYIKRVIGMPGDEVQMRDGVLYINGKAIPKRRVGYYEAKSENGLTYRIPKYEETLPNGVKYHVLDAEANAPFDNTRVFKVPAGHYFMMGDNRDNSNDSRGWGTVRRIDIKGPVTMIYWSWNNRGSWWSMLNPLTWWKLLTGETRWSRIGISVE